MATVLIAIDGSNFAENAFKWYVANFHKPANKVVLLHVIENLGIQDMSPARYLELQKEAKEKAEALKAKYTSLAKDLGVESAEVHIKTSDKPEHAIIEAADKGKATYIVSGSRGMGLLRRTILGSTSDFILHHAHCPVLICKAQ
ncbi:universal stress protein in QAH/OAS sulfhydrylase 3'region-like [Crassostrea virginica]